MNSLPYILTLLVVLPMIQLLIDYRLKYVSKDGRTKEHKTLRQVLLGVAILALTANPIVGWVSNAQKDRKANEERKVFDARISSLSAKQDNLLRRHKELLDILGTKSSVDATMRSRLLEYEQQFEIVSGDVVDLQKWRAAKNRREQLSQFKRQEDQRTSLQPIWDRSVPVYEYTIQRFQGMLSQIATQRFERLLSTFTGIPKELSFGPRGELRLGTNSNWHFKIRTYETPGLRIENGCVGLNVEASQTHVLVSFAAQCSYSNYQTNVDAGLRDLIVQVAERDETMKSQP